MVKVVMIERPQEGAGTLLTGTLEHINGRALLHDHAVSINATRLDTLRAKLISWVTTSMVIPS